VFAVFLPRKLSRGGDGPPVVAGPA
jgi:hypothetical protein